MSQGRLDEARAQIEESIARLSAVTAREPGNKVWVRDLALAHIEAGEMAAMREDSGSRVSHASTADRLIRGMKAAGDASLALQRLEAAARLSIVRFLPGTVEAGAQWDRAILGLERTAEDAKGGIHGRSILAKGLIHRGRYRSQIGATIEARSDGNARSTCSER